MKNVQVMDFEMGKNRLHGYDDWGLHNNYVKSYEGNDSMFTNPNSSSHLLTGYNQTDILSKLIFKPSEKLDLTLNFQYSTSSNINLPDNS